MLKERAASALKHGLPVPTPPPSRARAPNMPSARSSSIPPERAPAPVTRRMPLPVKLLGVGLLLLGVIYGLTLFRDHKSEPEAASAAPDGEPALAAVRTPPASTNAPNPAPGAGDSAAVSGVLPGVVGTAAPRVAADLAGALQTIPAVPPAQPRPVAAEPSRPAAPRPLSSGNPAGSKALVAPQPSPAGVRTNSPARPADNPY
jgi:hypothetical protein